MQKGQELAVARTGIKVFLRKEKSKYTPIINLKNYLACENEVGISGECETLTDEIRDRFHDVPRVFPPGESSEKAKLRGEIGEAAPHENVGSEVRALCQLCVMIV